MKSCLLITLLTFAAFLAEGQPAIETVNEASIDSLFRNWNSTESPGGVVAIVSKGEVLYKKAYGMADVDKKAPNHLNTIFNLASNVKQFVGTCIALLEEQNQLDTNNDLREYYPEFNLPEDIKLKNLLDHTSGIREGYVLATLSGKTNFKGKIREKYNTKEYLFEMLKRQKDLNFGPGDDFAYTNINYILLADIVEKVSGMSLRDFADSAIFRPLQMNQTVFQNYDENIENEASGYSYSSPDKFKEGKVWNGVKGDLNLLSSINDLIKWDLNFCTNNLGKKSNSLVNQLTTNTFLNNGRKTNYNYGLSKIQYRGFPAISHGGDNYLHTSLITRYPDFGLTIICLANSGRYYDIQQKVDKITDILLKDHFLDDPLGKRGLEYVEVDVEFLREKIGMYGVVNDNGLADYLEIQLRDSRLYMTPIPTFPGFELKPMSTNQFIAFNPEGEMIDLNFIKNGENGFEIHQNFRNEEKIIPKLQAIDEGVNRSIYKGLYVNESVGASIKIKSQKEKFFAKKGLIKINLIPFGPDRFFAPENDALFVFLRDPTESEVTSLIINASDFRNFKFMRK